MNIQTTLERPKPFDSYKAWEEEYARTGKLQGLLNRALMLIESNADRLERQGEDVSHLRAFIHEAHQ